MHYMIVASLEMSDEPQISVLGVNGFKKNHYLCGRFRNSKNEMQQNRMNITATNICRGSKGFEGMLYAPMSSILTFDNIGNTIQLKYTRTRILQMQIFSFAEQNKNRWKVPTKLFNDFFIPIGDVLPLRLFRPMEINESIINYAVMR